MYNRGIFALYSLKFDSNNANEKKLRKLRNNNLTMINDMNGHCPLIHIWG